MRGQAHTPSPDWRVADLAGAQHGVVGFCQLRELELTRSAIESAIRRGRLLPLHRGVYAVGHLALSRYGHWMAATLACGSHAVLSHGSAAALWGLRRQEEGCAEVTVPATRSRRRRAGIMVHGSRNMPAEEVTRREAIPVTTPARTLMDNAASLPRRGLERELDEAQRLGVLAEPELHALVAAHRGNRGAGRLGAVFEHHAIGSTLTRSELEELFLKLCRDHRIPQPRVNAHVESYTSTSCGRSAA